METMSPRSSVLSLSSVRGRRETKRVGIVGAGPGGLAVAMLLARAGVATTVYEQAPTVGGRTRTFTTEQGFRFDFGPTFFLYPRILKEIFAACGERLEDHVELNKLDPLYRLVFEGDDKLDIAADPARLEAEIGRIAPQDAAGLRKFLSENQEKLDAFQPVLEKPYHRLRDYLGGDFLRAFPQLRPFHTVDRDLRRYFSDHRVRLAFSFQTKYLGMSPFRCPSLFTILSFLEHGHGVFHPTGGCGAVSEAMARVARRLGAEVKTGVPVETLHFDGDKPVAVEAAGTRQPVDAVVINGDFTGNIRQLVPQRLRRLWPDKKIDRARISCSTFMLYLGIEGDIPGLQHHTILLASNYQRNIREIENGILPDEPSLYVQNACVTDATLAPRGHSSLYVLVPVPNLRAGIDWQAIKQDFRRRVLERLSLLGIHDIEGRIRYERVLTPVDWSQEFAIGEGATFNLAHDLMQMLYFRPHNRFGPGLYLVGGGTHPGSGLPVIYEGARITARLLMDELGVETPDKGLDNPQVSNTELLDEVA